MLPFRVEFSPGEPIYEQVVFAAKKALVGGQLRPGDRFPSVRQLSQELRINPNTAHKVVAALTQAGLIETHPGIGTVVTANPQAAPALRRDIIEQQVEHLVVEALQLSLTLEELQADIRAAWKSLSNPQPPKK